MSYKKNIEKSEKNDDFYRFLGGVKIITFLGGVKIDKIQNLAGFPRILKKAFFPFFRYGVCTRKKSKKPKT